METIHDKGDFDINKEVKDTENSATTPTENDPFRVRLKFSHADYLSMLVVFVLLVPVRVIVAFISLVLAWGISVIGLYDTDISTPVTGWKARLQQVMFVRVSLAKNTCLTGHSILPKSQYCQIMI